MTKPRRARVAARLGKERLEAMIEEATVDAYGEAEQATGWFTMIEEHLALSFETDVLGNAVKVIRVDLRDDLSIVAICTRRRERQAVPILDLPLLSSRPAGSEWIEAYRRSLGGEC